MTRSRASHRRERLLRAWGLTQREAHERLQRSRRIGGGAVRLLASVPARKAVRP